MEISIAITTLITFMALLVYQYIVFKKHDK